MKVATLVISDGTLIKAGDKVRARLEDGKLRVAEVLWIERGGKDGVKGSAALLSPRSRIGPGTVVRQAYEIKPYVTKREARG